jgi:adenylate cyclase
MSKNKKAFLKDAAFNLIFWVIAANLFVIFRYLGINSFYIPKTPRDIGMTFLEGNIIAVITGFLLSVVDILLEKDKFKRKSFRYIMLLKSISYSFMIFISIVIMFLIHGLFTSKLDAFVFYLNFTISSDYTIALYIYAVIICIMLNFIKQVNKKFGPGVLWKLFSGRYHQPRQEERIFMFLDLRSSTEIAEKLGHIKYSQFIQDCFYDITTIISDFRAEIYQYVGDEIVLTWEIEKGIEGENCFRFYFAFKRLLFERKKYYLNRFGVVPEFKAGMNCGFVTVAEVGEIKKEIAYHGDVLNTAARIQNQCNTYKKDILISYALHKLMPRFEGFKGELIGEVILKGKHIPTGLYSLEMA